MLHLHHWKSHRNKPKTRDLVQDRRLHRRTETSSSRLGCNNNSSKRVSSSKDRLRRKLGNSTRTCSNIPEANPRTADPHNSRCQTAASKCLSNNSKVEAVQAVVQGSPRTTSSPLIKKPWDETSIPAVIAFISFTICVQCFLCTFFTFSSIGLAGLRYNLRFQQVLLSCGSRWDFHWIMYSI